MEQPNSRSGGFFWALCITAGLIAGVLAGNTMAGVLLGFGAGAAMAIGTWAMDRKRSG